jgi:hypothetical protein
VIDSSISPALLTLLYTNGKKNLHRGNQLSNRQRRKGEIKPKRKALFDLTPARMTGGGWMDADGKPMHGDEGGWMHS